MHKVLRSRNNAHSTGEKQVETMSEAVTSKVSFERERGVYAIQVTRDVAHAVIHVGESDRTRQIVHVFRILARADVPVFLIKHHRTAITLALAGTLLPRAESVLSESGISFRTRRDMALVTVRAAQMRELSGIMVAIADALAEAGATLFDTGDSHNSVQCLIDAERTSQAVESLCRTFHLEPGAVREYSVEEAAE
jgi:aspartate kinase